MMMGRAILEDVARERGLSVREIAGPRRWQYLVDARRDAAHRMRSELGYSFPLIARVLGRTHTTIVYMLSEKYREHKRALYLKKRRARDATSRDIRESPRGGSREEIPYVADRDDADSRGALL